MRPHTHVEFHTQDEQLQRLYDTAVQKCLNNHLLFMRHQREDGRLAGSIQGFADGTVEAQFNKFQGFCFPWSALNMYYFLRPSPGKKPGAGALRV